MYYLMIKNYYFLFTHNTRLEYCAISQSFSVGNVIENIIFLLNKYEKFIMHTYITSFYQNKCFFPFRETFGEPSGDTPEVGELLEQRIDTWRILHLISKERHSDKPSLENIIKTFKALKNHIVANNIKQVAIPHINCGLDGHTWPCIKYILGQELKGVNVQITICE